MVLIVRRSMVMTSTSEGKFYTEWEGPFVVESLYSNGTYNLTKLDNKL